VSEEMILFLSTKPTDTDAVVADVVVAGAEVY
jgi:hypothetical protein